MSGAVPRGSPHEGESLVGQQDPPLEAWVSPEARGKLEVVGNKENLLLLHQDPEGT